MIIEKCEVLPSLNNGQISYDKAQVPSGGYPLKTWARFTCDRGYTPFGPIGMQCRASGNGTWASNIPRCKLSNKTKF